MQNVQFIETLEGVNADLLILKDSLLQMELDKKLNGALSFNLKHLKPPVIMTTNGAYPIAQIVIANENDDIASLANQKTVALALNENVIEKAAFEILLMNPRAESLIFLCRNAKATERSFENYRYLLEGVSYAKKIISAPSNLMPPHEFAKRCVQLQSQGVNVEVFSEEKLKEIGASALLAVGQGSINSSSMVVMEWKGDSNSINPTVIVGKGICFDAGGINLKTAYLTEMKWDKAGAGVAFGVIDVLSKMKAPVHVVAILMLAENMPDGGAIKPGDVIPTLSGKTVEIIDTDCEGRLALADGLSYAQMKFKPKALIDLGTLTLETFGALGSEYAGLFCNNADLSSALIDAGSVTNEKLWLLPLGQYYANQVRSTIADLKNVGVFRYGASSAAAEFLRAFVNPQIPWAHIDISGTAWKLDAPEEGVTGFGIRLLVKYLTNLS